MAKAWRDAASLIIVARNHILPQISTKLSSAYDYQILMLRRSSKSQFMPNAYVFPGGVASKADFDPQWESIFMKYGSGSKESLLAPKGARRPFLMTSDAQEALPREVAFRITALRETFEESALLLTCDKKQRIEEQDLLKWRTLVHDDPHKFLEMCQEFEICPDLWDTMEWSCWLTPLGRGDPGNRRFDTLFLTTFAEKGLSTATLDDKEITHVQWSNPDALLSDSLQQKLWLAPPQVYELTRFSQYKTFDSLREACEERKPYGFDTWMPVFYKCADGLLSILPGDELYPQDPDYLGARPPPDALDMTIVEVNDNYPRANRMAIYNKHKVKPFVTISEGDMVLS